MTIKILAAAHKAAPMPDSPIYLPIHVGREGKPSIGFIGDNTGDHISSKNKNYCELTGIYWAYKNLKADYIGLCHYRRHFYIKKKENKMASILNEEEAARLLKEAPILVPSRRKYYIESNYSHYIHAHHREGLDLAGKIIASRYPEYKASYDLVMNRTWAHMFNMFVMKKEYFDSYCGWLFDILSQVEKSLDISSYSPYEARVFGFISELLLDVWLEGNQLPYREVPVMFMESQNWLIKGFGFLKRKFFPSSHKK